MKDLLVMLCNWKLVLQVLCLVIYLETTRTGAVQFRFALWWNNILLPEVSVDNVSIMSYISRKLRSSIDEKQMINRIYKHSSPYFLSCWFRYHTRHVFVAKSIMASSSGFWSCNRSTHAGLLLIWQAGMVIFCVNVVPV